MSVTPITLSGNLGQRHRHLNTLVREASVSGASFQDFQALPELSAVDRLFKIDLASQLRHVDYILQNLQDDDMLYVSRALKSKWLVEQHDVINPKYLEDVLYPNMIQPAVSKLKHWIYINLRDPSMSQEFYLYYKENTFEFAIKFLSHCSNEFILNEIPTILSKISTHHLKILCERCPKVAEIYYNSLATDEDETARYLENERSYYNSVKCVLKADADVFLDITEKYFNMNSFSRLSPSSTDYILRCHKHRFTAKPELYVAYVLHIPTLADRLSVEESQELVIRLARAKYLQHWFQYKAVEPLVKRLSPDKRAAFKKRVFVDKDVGESVDDWPYKVPAPPTHSYPEAHVFDDQDFSPLYGGHGMLFGRSLMPCSARFYCDSRGMQMPQIVMKTELDRLFDEFRFVGFSRALHDLGQRLGAAGSPDRRRDIFLVLVSKSGGRSDAVSALLSLAARHSNEPAHIRAAVLRSLVKRAQVWRLPADVWQNFVEFGHGLGLDGTTAEADCKEGLHAVVIRQLLDGGCDEAVCAAFLNEFSTLSEYSLSADERQRVAAGLQNLLSAAALVAEPVVAAKRLDQLLDALSTYRVRIEPTSPTVEAIVSLASRDAAAARPLLQRLYNVKVGRRELLRLNLEFRRDQASLMNALRHDLPALECKEVGEILATSRTNFDSFVTKLATYFQTDDLVTQLRAALKEKCFNDKKMKLARPLASLSSGDLEIELQELDLKGSELKRLTAALRASAHRGRPVVAAAEWGWRKAGVKAVATRAMRGRQVERAEFTRALAAHRRTVRVALALSMLSDLQSQVDTFTLATKLRPAAALRALLLYFRRFGDKSDVSVWNVVKPVMLSIDLSPRENLRRLVKEQVKVVPSSLKSDYCLTLYLALVKTKNKYFKCQPNADEILCNVSKHLTEVENSLEPVLLQMLEVADVYQPLSYPSIFVRYLMLSKSDDDLAKRFEKIGKPFLDHLDTVRNGNQRIFRDLMSQTMKSLLYNSAFFDTKYTSCLLVIEKFIDWMQKFMPKEENFKKYAQIHLTMLYHKAVRQSMKQMPAVFAEPRRKLAEGVDAVGFVFGRYIAQELAQLVSTYFDSVVELYSGALAGYLESTLRSGSSRAKFVTSVLKGILAEGVGSQRRLAVYILKFHHNNLKKSLQDELEELMYKDKDIELLVHAYLPKNLHY